MNDGMGYAAIADVLFPFLADQMLDGSQIIDDEERDAHVKEEVRRFRSAGRIYRELTCTS